MRQRKVARAGLLAVLSCGCADLFNLEHVASSGIGKDGGDSADAITNVAPTQQVITQHNNASGSDTRVELTFAVAPTTPGHTLVLISVIETSNHSITSVIDNGGNTWTKLVEGDDSANVVSCRLDAWHADGATAAETITVALSADRDFAATFVEWPIHAPVDGSIGGVFANTATPSTPVLSVQRRALLVAMLAYCGSQTANLGDIEFTALRSSTISTSTAAGAYRIAVPGTYNASWTFSNALPTVIGLVALALD